MNFGGDQRVRNAFRATLLDEPSSSSLIAGLSSLGTQEVDAADVLEVTDLANAIAKAEALLRAQSSRALFASAESSGARSTRPAHPARSSDRAPMDLFDHLVATDDTAGPATHLTHPAHLAHAPTLLPRIPSTVTLATPRPSSVRGYASLLTQRPQIRPPGFNAARAVPSPVHEPAHEPAHEKDAQDRQDRQDRQDDEQAARTAPILILDEDAFYHPAGRIRTFADATLDGYRPEPTRMLRLRARRHTLSWVFFLVVAPIALFALFAGAVVFGRAAAERDTARAMALPALPTPPTAEAAGTADEQASGATAAAAAVTPTAIPTTTTTQGEPPGTDSAPTRGGSPEVPTLDVNSLSSAPAATKRP